MSLVERSRQNAAAAYAVVAAKRRVERHKREHAIARGGTEGDGSAEEVARHLADEHVGTGKEHDVERRKPCLSRALVRCGAAVAGRQMEGKMRKR